MQVSSVSASNGTWRRIREDKSRLETRDLHDKADATDPGAPTEPDVRVDVAGVGGLTG